MAEKPIQTDVRLAAGSRPDVRLFRNNTGAAFQGDIISTRDRVLILRDFRQISFGLHVGSSDLVGWKSVVVTPDMVGQRVAIFLCVETKAKRGVKSTEQENWVDQVRRAGGLAGFARSVDEATDIIDGGTL